MSDLVDDELRRLLAFEALGGTRGMERFVELVAAGELDGARAELGSLSHSEVVEIAVRMAGAHISYATGRREYARLVGIIAREAEALLAVAREHGLAAMSGTVSEIRAAADSLADPPD